MISVGSTPVILRIFRGAFFAFSKPGVYSNGGVRDCIGNLSDFLRVQTDSSIQIPGIRDGCRVFSLWAGRNLGIKGFLG